MSIELRAQLPMHKSDFARTDAIIELGYPAVAPVIPQLLEWLQDCNWPISHRIARFLVEIGEPVFPFVREVFNGTDGTWKYWCIGRFIDELPIDQAAKLRPELQRLAYHPTPGDHSDEVDEMAREALKRLDAVGSETR